MATPAQIQKIHILKSALKIDEDTYRATLTGFGVKSSKDRAFTIGKADELIQGLVEKAVAAGVWEKRKPARKAKVTRQLADSDQSKKIRQLWIELHQVGKVKNSSEDALEAYVKRMTRVDKLQWLDVAQASKVIEALKKWLSR
jgi:phage gp16-like protein